ncbi:hypothetical protein D9M68_961690 [compost metagenome]
MRPDAGASQRRAEDCRVNGHDCLQATLGVAAQPDLLVDVETGQSCRFGGNVGDIESGRGGDVPVQLQRILHWHSSPMM